MPLRRHRIAGLVVAAVIAGYLPGLGATAASAATLPPGLTDTVVASGLGAPTAVAALPDGRFLVTSQEGKLYVVENGTHTVALDLAALSKVCSNSEEGLLGVTVDSQFATNGEIYLYYTAQIGSCALNGASPGGAKNRVSRFTMSNSKVSAATEVILLDNMPEWGGNHNGGYVGVANDGTLFVTVGDGGAGRPDTNPSDLSMPNGKILRINRDGTIPAGNPHGTTVCKTAWGPPGASKVCGEIWADGLRNPFRLGFDAAAAGAKFRVNDVGDNTWEEVNEGIVGAHYGWPCREGPAAHASSASCNTPTTDPVLWYNHSTGCNVETGGAFVPAGTWPGYTGDYLWVDFGCGELFLAQPGQTGTPPAVLATGMAMTTDLEFFQVGGRYSLFSTTYANGGELHRFDAEATPWQPLGGTVSAAPGAASDSSGLYAFVRSGDGALSWRRLVADTWSPYQSAGGFLLSSPSPVTDASGVSGTAGVYVFGVGGDGGVYWQRFSGGVPSGWHPLGGVATSPVAVTVDASGLSIAVRGGDNALYVQRLNANVWSGWQPLGGFLSMAPSLASDSSGVYALVTGGDGGLYSRRLSSGVWAPYLALGGVLTSPPTGVTDPTGISVFVRGGDGALWWRHQSGGVWSGWHSLGGFLLSDPIPVADGAGEHVFVVGGGPSLYTIVVDGASATASATSDDETDTGGPPPGPAANLPSVGGKGDARGLVIT